MPDAKTIREEAVKKALGETAEPQRKYSWDLNVINQDPNDPQKSFAMVGAPGADPKRLYVGDYTPEGDAVVGFEDKGIRLLPEQEGSQEYTRYMGGKQPTSSTSEDPGAGYRSNSVAGDSSQLFMEPDLLWRALQPKLVEHQQSYPEGNIGAHTIDARNLLAEKLQVEPGSLQFKDYYPNFDDPQSGAEYVYFQDADGQTWEVIPGAKTEDGYPQITRATSSEE